MFCHIKKERTILKLLDEFPNNNLEDTPNISFIGKKENLEIILTYQD